MKELLKKKKKSYEMYQRVNAKDTKMSLFLTYQTTVKGNSLHRQKKVIIKKWQLLLNILKGCPLAFYILLCLRLF